MLPVNCGSHIDYQHFVVTNLRKYYPDPDALARSTWDIIFVYYATGIIISFVLQVLPWNTCPSGLSTVSTRPWAS